MVLVAAGGLLGRMQTAFRDKGLVDPVSRLLQFSVYPLAKPFARSFIAMSEFGSGIVRARTLVAQNEALKSQMINYATYSERVSELTQEVDGYRKMLSLPITGRKAINLDVIGISQADGTLVLNAGTELGIKPDQPVVNGDGLVGLIQTVSKGESRAALLTGYGVKIFAVDGSRTPPEEGLVSGVGSSTLTMLMLIPKDPVSSGDTILTSLKSKNIPPGLVVGRVISVEDDPYYGTRRLTVDPAVNLGTIHQVQVLQ